MAVKSIKDINDKYDYEDTAGSSGLDSLRVSCGQNGNYNELKYIYDTYLKQHVDEGDITEQEALNALNDACVNLRSPRSRTKFYEYLSKKLGVPVG